MNDELIERIAKAMVASENPLIKWDQQSERWREMWRGFARAALTALDEDEWEYGRVSATNWSMWPGSGVQVLANTEDNIQYQRDLGYLILRRRKAGPWSPVPAVNETETKK